MVPELTIIVIVLLVLLGWLVTYRLKRQSQKRKRQENEVWSIGIYEGPNPVTLAPASGIINPILTADDIADTDARFVADPFMITSNGIYHLFLELLNKKRNTGEIGHAESEDLRSWKYTGVALKEKFHLSYPYVFSHEDMKFMIPECAKSNEIRLYRAIEFPLRWELAATLLKGNKKKVPLLDPSVVFHNGYWYLFSYMRKVNNLHLFISENLTGPWKEHPESPIVRGNDHFARPGGRIVKDGLFLYRYAQDGVPRYGSKAWGFRISELTPTRYSEEPVSDKPVVQAGNKSWNNRGMHTVDPHKISDGRWIAFVDGLEHRTATKAEKNAQ
ncbi:MAG: hypothetical protein K9G39_11060 [Chlorobium sp.]|uniref:glucosamine inositolphosphorylceramide transferase family protein n=1 Tax=Chlorobium sp. TaxID=1095 RepID=UPI0025C43088|nr:hypothetical protein [Chlorobium sp.]MCF8384108.1 hypothetical protein [Chlorobium sp.]